MIAFTWNLMLALVWVMVTGNFSGPNLVAGFVFGYAILRFTQGGNPRFVAYFGKIPKLIRFVVLFVWDLIKSNVRVAYDVLTPTHHMRPAVIAVPLEEGISDAAITVLANSITLTPGTLSLDVSSDRKTLYIHAMYLDDEAALRAEIKTLERRVIELLG